MAEAQKACMALPAGTAVVADPIKENTPEAIAALKHLGLVGMEWDG